MHPLSRLLKQPLNTPSAAEAEAAGGRSAVTDRSKAGASKTRASQPKRGKGAAHNPVEIGDAKNQPLGSAPAPGPEPYWMKLFDDERFRIVTETMVDGLIVIDGLGAVLYVNSAFETLFGYTAGEIVGRNVRMLMPSPYAEAHDGYLARHRETRVKRIIGRGRELTGLRKDGRRFPMYLSVGETAHRGDTFFVGVIYDLSEKRRAEEMLLHHQKLDAIGQLSGGVAHDFNNILAVISGNLEMLETHDLPPAARRAVARAQDAAGRAARITHRLLAFARRQPLSPQRLDLNQVLTDLSEMLHRSLGETIDLVMRLAPDLGPVEADIDQFETAILNLAVNARDAMPAGGQLVVETEAVEFEDDPQHNMEVPAGRYVRVSVSDNGAGMTPEVQSHAVEPFFTTKEPGAGTGLGLSMVYGFLKQIGGHARIYSEFGKGTRVSLFFPLNSEATATKAAEPVEAMQMGRGETVLVAEDDPEVRHVTVSRLQRLGYRVRVAVDAASALAALEADGPADLALLDVVMPGGMNGHELADAIAQRWPKTAIVLTSGYSPVMATARGRSAYDFLSKPASLPSLAAALRSALDARGNHSQDR